jgi:hypothetical protein
MSISVHVNVNEWQLFPRRDPTPALHTHRPHYFSSLITTGIFNNNKNNRQTNSHGLINIDIDPRPDW